MTALTRTARTRAVSSSGAPTAAAQAASASDRRPGALAGGQSGSGPLLIWTEGSAGTGDVYLQPLNSSGAMQGTATAITMEANADGTLDAVVFPSGGAIVFGALVDGVHPEVRFRAIDDTGMPTGDERVLGTGKDGSIAAFAGGFVVSYRTVASGTTPPEIHVLLVSALGDVVEDIMLVQAAPSGGRTTIRVSGDGQIAVTWANATDTGVDVQLAFLSCGTGG